MGVGVGVGVGGIVLLALAGGVGRELGRALTSGSPETPRSDLQAALNRTVDELNRSVPKVIDRDTELTSVAALPNAILYRYRLLTLSVNDLDAPAVAAMKRDHAVAVVNSACTTPQTRDSFLKRGVTMKYMYVDRDSRFLLEIAVTPADCGF
jgi:hypothetical protein